MPHTRIVARLKAVTAVTALIGTGNDAKIYPINAPQDTDGDYITHQTVSDESINASVGATGTKHCRLQIISWSDDYDGARALAAAVEGDGDPSAPTGIAGWTIASGTPAISSCHLDGGDDMPSGMDPEQNTRKHGFSQDYIVWYNA